MIKKLINRAIILITIVAITAAIVEYTDKVSNIWVAIPLVIFAMIAISVEDI